MFRSNAEFVKYGGFDVRRNLGPATIQSLQLGALSFDAVKHLLLCHIERRPPRLDLDCYPHLPLAQVATTAAADYLSLLGAAAV